MTYNIVYGWYAIMICKYYGTATLHYSIIVYRMKPVRILYCKLGKMRKNKHTTEINKLSNLNITNHAPDLPRRFVLAAMVSRTTGSRNATVSRRQSHRPVFNLWPRTTRVQALTAEKSTIAHCENTNSCLWSQLHLQFILHIIVLYTHLPVGLSCVIHSHNGSTYPIKNEVWRHRWSYLVTEPM